MKGMIYSILVFISNISAIFSTLKYKNKMVQGIVEFIYCAIIFLFPVFVLSIILFLFGGNTDVNLWDIFRSVAYIVALSCIYYIFTNRKSENRIEEYIFIMSLSLQHYLNDEQRCKKQKKKIIVYLLSFFLLFILFFCSIFSLITLFRAVTYSTTWISFIVSLCFTYVLFVYGKRDEKEIEERKSIIGISISIVWFILALVRMNHYWKDINQISLEDMFILFFSVIFTIPTIWGWIRNILAIIMHPYKDKINEQKEAMIESCIILGNKCNKGRIQFINDVKAVVYIVKSKWNKAEKRKKIKTIFSIIGIVVMVAIGIVMAVVLKELISLAISGIKEWYADVDKNIQDIFEQLLGTLFLGGVIVYTIVKIPVLYNTKSNWSEKIKYIIAVVILEGILGSMIWAIWFGI